MPSIGPSPGRLARQDAGDQQLGQVAGVAVRVVASADAEVPDAAHECVCAPLKPWGAGPGKKVATAGLRGLGHVGVKIAHALGAEVPALCQSLRKKDDGLKRAAPWEAAARWMPGCGGSGSSRPWRGAPEGQAHSSLT